MPGAPLEAPESIEAPTRCAPANKGRRYPAEVLTPEEVRRLIRAASGRAARLLMRYSKVAFVIRPGPT